MDLATNFSPVSMKQWNNIVARIKGIGYQFLASINETVEQFVVSISNTSDKFVDGFVHPMKTQSMQHEN
jgi:hypothetical protein